MFLIWDGKMKKLLSAIGIVIALCSNSYAQQGVLSLESQPSQFQAVRPQGLLNNTVPIRPLYNLPVVPCIATAAAPVLTEGAFVNCSMDLSGNLRTSGGGGGGGGGTSSNFGAAFPAAGTAAGFSDGTNMQGARVFDLNSGGGTEYGLGVNLRFIGGAGSVEAGTVANPLNIAAASLPLPTGAATEATLATLLTSATFTGRFPAGSTPADNESNAVSISRIGTFNYVFDGTTWDRWTGGVSQVGTWNINNISGTISLPTGAATEATLSTRLADSTFTGRFAAAFASADGISNQTTTAVHGLGFMYNGTTWDRLRGTIASGLLVNVSNAFVLDATVTNRLPAGSTPADNESNAITTSRLGVYNYIFDGATWDRWTGAVTGSGNFTVVQPTGTNLHIVCDSGCGGATSFADNSAFTFGTTAVNNMGAVVDDTATNTVTENNAGAPRMNTNRILYGLPTNSTGTALYPSAAALADATANPTLTQIGTFLHGYNGTTWDRLRSSIANGLLVDVSDAFLLDATLTARFPAGSTPADNESNAVTISRIGAFNYIFDGTTWDRWTGGVSQLGTWNINNISGTISLPTGAATETTLGTRLADSTFTGRFAAAFTSADGIANQTTTAIHGFGYMYNGTTWDRIRGTTADGLLVNLGANNDVTVTGTVTANAGTNLNTSALALDATLTNRFPAGSTPADNESNAVTITRFGNFGFVFDGTTWDRMRGDSTDGLLVNLGANNDVVQATAANLNVRPDTSGATAAAPPARADFVGGLTSGATGGLLTGIGVCDQYVNVNVNTATTTLLVTGVAGRHVRICSLSLVTALANNVALLSGTGATCGTGTTGMSGGTTAATGWNFAANGGITQGSGLGVINQTNATGDSVCIATSAASQLSGRIAFAIY